MLLDSGENPIGVEAEGIERVVTTTTVVRLCADLGHLRMQL